MMKKEKTAYEEALSLYHAWLGVLLRRMGEGELRVKAREIKEGLGRLSCETIREGDEYVIRLKHPTAPEAIQRREDLHGGEKE